MKKILFTLSLIVSSIVNSQSITAENFDSEKMNRALLSEFNKFRKERNLDTLIYSKPLHDSVSYPNCLEVSSSGKLYHPVITERWINNGVKNLISDESKNLFNDKISTSSNTGLPAMEYWENIFRSDVDSFNSYEEMAKHAIECWENSPGHKKTQNTSFLSNNLPGFFACHSIYVPNGHIYIFINFVRVLRF
jgi:hypothetical protein